MRLIQVLCRKLLIEYYMTYIS